MEATLTLEQKVIQVIAEQLGLDAREVKLDASLVDDYNCDSLDAVELIMAAEEEFEIVISDEEAEAVKTGRDILAIVERARG